MATVPLCPVIVVFPPAGDGSGPAFYLSGLIQSQTTTSSESKFQPISDPASVDPTQYQVAVYTWLIPSGWNYQGCVPLSICGTWSLPSGTGNQYYAVLMDADVAPPQGCLGNNAPVVGDNGVRAVLQVQPPFPPSPAPNSPPPTTPPPPPYDLAGILAMPNDVFPQFLGSATAAFQACANFLGCFTLTYSQGPTGPATVVPYTEQQVLSALNPSLILRLTNNAAGIAAQNQVDPVALNAVIAQLSQWVTNESDINYYFQQMWDFLVDEFLPQSTIISTVAGVISSDLVQNQSQNIDWWSFALNLVTLGTNLGLSLLNLALPGLGLVAEEAFTTFVQVSINIGQFVVGAVNVTAQAMINNPPGYTFDSNGLVQMTIAELESQVLASWQTSLNNLQTKQIQVSNYWRCLQWLSGAAWNVTAAQAVVNSFAANFAVMVWSTLVPLKWNVQITGDSTNNWATNAQCLANMDADPTVVFNSWLGQGSGRLNVSNSSLNRLIYRFCEIASGEAIYPSALPTLWDTASPGIGLTTAPPLVPFSYDHFEILTGPAAGQTSSNWSLTSGLSVAWGDGITLNLIGLASQQMLLAADNTVVTPAARANPSTVTPFDPIAINFSGLLGFTATQEGGEAFNQEFMCLVLTGSQPSVQSMNGYGVASTGGLLGGRVVIQTMWKVSGELHPVPMPAGLYDLYYVVCGVSNSSVTSIIGTPQCLQPSAVQVNPLPPS